jgi:hypothetical protein
LTAGLAFEYMAKERVFVQKRVFLSGLIQRLIQQKQAKKSASVSAETAST